MVTASVLWYIYTDGVYVKRLMQAHLLGATKKHLHMAGVVMVALFVYYLIKKNPLQAREVLVASSDYVKYLPVDRNTKDMITPLLDMTREGLYASSSSSAAEPTRPASRIMMSGKQNQSTKRSVSETKKKFVAARQNWMCAHCGVQLTAWFEVDHKVRLEHGGSNHVDNLCALCAECHRHKSGMENMNKEMSR